LDFTTLTGAGRVALGPDIGAVFSNDPDLSAALLKKASEVQDPLLEFPLYKPYRKYIDSQIADLSNAANIPYGGAMTAALFLNEFVPADISWAHFDLMAWNLTAQPGRPIGGEAMGLRAVWRYLVEKV
jgi:leucyl aminopeptidase